MAKANAQGEMLAKYYHVDEFGQEVLIGTLYQGSTGRERMKWCVNRKKLPQIFTLRCRNVRASNEVSHAEL